MTERGGASSAVGRSGSPLELSIVVPAYDAATFIAESVEELLSEADRLRMSTEVVVVDDGSRDRTVSVVRAIADRDARVRLVRLPANRGKGAAVRAGVPRCRGEVIAFTDADVPYTVSAIDRVVERLGESTDVVVGARDLAENGKSSYGVHRRLASAVYGQIVGRAFSLGVVDTQCGLKAFRAPVARALFAASTIDGFAFDVELLLLAQRWGLRVAQVGVTMRTSTRSSVHLPRHSVLMARDLVRLHRRMRQGELPERPRDLGEPPFACGELE